MRRFILNNIWWKLFSLVLAAGTWYAISSSQEKVRTESAQSPITTVSYRTFPSVPITILASPLNTNQFRLDPPTLSVEVSGKHEDLLRLQMSEILAFVDATQVGEEKEVRRTIQLQAPKEIKIINSTPQNATVERIIPTEPL